MNAFAVTFSTFSLLSMRTTISYGLCTSKAVKVTIQKDRKIYLVADKRLNYPLWHRLGVGTELKATQKHSALHNATLYFQMTTHCTWLVRILKF